MRLIVYVLDNHVLLITRVYSMHVCWYVQLYKYMYVSMYVCMFVAMYVYGGQWFFYSAPPRGDPWAVHLCELVKAG